MSVPQPLREPLAGERSLVEAGLQPALPLPPGVIARVQGTAGQAGAINANGRAYPARVYEKAVDAFHRQSQAAVLGELDHPAMREGARLERTAIQVVDLTLTDGRLEFTAHVLDTPCGRILHDLVIAGVPIGVSTRGRGTLIPRSSTNTPTGMKNAPSAPGYFEVAEDYELEGIDLVVRGAHAGAAIHGMASGQPCPAVAGPAHEERSMDMQTLSETLPQDPDGQPEGPMSPVAEAPHSSLDSAHVEELEAALAESRRGLEAQAQELGRLRQETAGLREALDRQAAQDEARRIAAGLRPDLRSVVESRLAECATPDVLQERWAAIESVLSAAGLLSSEPAGAGHLAEGNNPAYSPVQELQRRLLAGE